MNFMTILKDLLPLIQHSAPLLCSALFSQGKIAEVAFNLLCKVFNCDVSTPEKLIESITGDTKTDDKLAFIENAWTNIEPHIVPHLVKDLSKAELTLKVEWTAEDNKS